MTVGLPSTFQHTRNNNQHDSNLQTTSDKICCNPDTLETIQNTFHYPKLYWKYLIFSIVCSNAAVAAIIERFACLILVSFKNSYVSLFSHVSLYFFLLPLPSRTFVDLITNMINESFQPFSRDFQVIFTRKKKKKILKVLESFISAISNKNNDK